MLSKLSCTPSPNNGVLIEVTDHNYAVHHQQLAKTTPFLIILFNKIYLGPFTQLSRKAGCINITAASYCRYLQKSCKICQNRRRLFALQLCFITNDLISVCAQTYPGLTCSHSEELQETLQQKGYIFSISLGQKGLYGSSIPVILIVQFKLLYGRAERHYCRYIVLSDLSLQELS